MSSAEGWAAQRLGLPAEWYQHIAESTGLEFPISADATAHYQRDLFTCITQHNH
jgi:hypothetical protein